MSGGSGVDSQFDLEEKANLFINSIQADIDPSNQQEVRTKEELLMDSETIETLKKIRV